MRIFLSYARADERVAAEIELALRTEGHDVFFDRASLPSGDAFHRAIREQLDAAERLVFLVSPASIRRGSYALTELKFARERWRNPAGRVLPVMVERTRAELPPYLRAVTVLDPVGNVAAEVAAAISKMRVPEPLQPPSSVRVLMHAACFVNQPQRPALFINVANLSADREVEVTHVWIETTPKTYAPPAARPLPARLRAFESWETWVYVDELPTIPSTDVYELARVRLSTGEVAHSSRNLDVPERGYVPGSNT